MRSPVIVGQEGRSSTEGLWVMDLLLVSGAFTLRGCAHVIVRKGLDCARVAHTMAQLAVPETLEGWCVFSPGTVRCDSAVLGLAGFHKLSTVPSHKLHDIFTRREDAMV